jgi:hypothetical protein
VCPDINIKTLEYSSCELDVITENKIRDLEEKLFELYHVTNNKSIRNIVVEAYKTANENYGIEEAIQWADNFSWPKNIADRDLRLFETSEYSLSRMTRCHHRNMAPNRLSRDRINRVVGLHDPDRKLLLDLVNGMRVFVASDFQPNASPPPQRSLYKRVSSAVNKLLYDLWKQELVYILPTAIVKSKVLGLHYSPAHWTIKTGKKCGRNIFDSSDSSHGNALNSDEANKLINTYYGDIKHPGIGDLVDMINSFKEDLINSAQSFVWEDIVLWKADLAGAFTLLDFRSADVHLLACELTDGLTLIYHTGLFGWTGTPYAFQVITRTLKRNINILIKGRCEMYVDDILGVTLKKWLEYDKECTYSICTNLLGPTAIAKHKWECGRRIDMIGWTVDLDISIVSIARKNFLKTL